jgi:thiamine-phosphate pyrophosphorylase
VTGSSSAGPPDLSLYLATDAALCAERGVGPTVRAAVAGGVTAVQLRDPHATTRALYDQARALLAQLDGTAVPLLVNDRLDVALAAGAAGVHLGQTDLPPVEARRLAGPDLVIGWSVSTADEVEAAGALPPGTVDYLGVGPVFATSTKPDAATPLGLAGLAQLREKSSLPCVAIGGVGVGNARAVARTGVVGLCMVSALCAAEDPTATAEALRRAVGR